MKFEELRDYLEGLLGKPLYKQEKNELIHMINLRDSSNRLQRDFYTLRSYLWDNYKIELLNNTYNFDGEKIKLWVLCKFR